MREKKCHQESPNAGHLNVLESCSDHIDQLTPTSAQGELCLLEEGL